MRRIVRTVSAITLALFAFGCNTMRTTPAIAPDSNPLMKSETALPSGTARPLPILQEIGHGTGDDIPASPVFTPPVAKKVWRVGHRISDVVYVSGYWLYFMYDPGRFAPLPSGRAAIPVMPKLERKPKAEKAPAAAKPQVTRHEPPAPGKPQEVNDLGQESAMRVAEKIRQMQQAHPGTGGGQPVED